MRGPRTWERIGARGWAHIGVIPRIGHLRLFDFHRAKEAIEEGHRAVERVAQGLADLDARQ